MTGLHILGHTVKINLVTDLIWWYNVLKDEQSRKLYIDIMKHLLDTVNNNQSKEMIHIFFNKLNI